VELAAALGVSLPVLRWLTYQPSLCGGGPLPSLRHSQEDGRGAKYLRPQALAGAGTSLGAHPDPREARRRAGGARLLDGALGWWNPTPAPTSGARWWSTSTCRDFFPSITFRRVKGLFAKLATASTSPPCSVCSAPNPPRVEERARRKSLSRGPLASGSCRRALARAPPSPMRFCRRLDRRLAGIARRLPGHLPPDLRRRSDLLASTITPSWPRCCRVFAALVKKEGFAENEDKDAGDAPGQRQESPASW